MTYGEMRDSEQLSQLRTEITNFISRYGGNNSVKNRKTLILFPGGMGSRLLRADTPISQGPPDAYDTVWLDCSILAGVGLYLQMQADIDYDKQIIVPNGPVDFMELKPYDKFIEWCDSKGIDYFIFGWDWRRDMGLTVDFFLNSFLPLFQQSVKRKCNADPLKDFALIGHSMGGLIVKLIMNRSNNSYVRLMKQAVTVATPFYGYGGQLPRYFMGDPDLERVGYGKRQLTRIISSFAACYALLFLDEATYNRDCRALAADPHYPLLDYPILDANTRVVADPYNPKTKNGKVRYPNGYGFDKGALKRGKQVYQQIAARLDAAISNKFFNFRGVQVKNNAIVNGTVNKQTWDWITPNFDPQTNSSPSYPITDYKGPGDGVLPAWSTRSVYTPAANVRTLRGNIEHMSMMSYRPVLNELAKVI
jgi:pimeloyl-ACP methyl ester carboxylesterase